MTRPPLASRYSRPIPNRAFFKELNLFRFDDQTRVNFRGDAELSVLGRQGTQGNSNECGSKGFMTTFALPRTFVKAYLKDDPALADSYRFAPHFARTMNEANEAFDDPADHFADRLGGARHPSKKLRLHFAHFQIPRCRYLWMDQNSEYELGKGCKSRHPRLWLPDFSHARLSSS